MAVSDERVGEHPGLHFPNAPSGCRRLGPPWRSPPPAARQGAPHTRDTKPFKAYGAKGEASGAQMRRLTSQLRGDFLPILLILLFLASLNWSLMLLRSKESEQISAGDRLAIKEDATAQEQQPEVNAESADSGIKTIQEKELIDPQPTTPPNDQDRSTATDYFDSGVRRFFSGDKAGAITDYSNAIAKNPSFAMAYYNRGDAKRHLGDYKGAVQDFSLSLKLQPRYAEAWGNRGLAKTKLGDKQDGCQDLKRGAALGSKISESLYGQICSE
ncbi:MULTISPECIES: tetratricopeptide repeat protein [Aphanothece]|uniref:tetratricopeptide repeat protein n=1 Tax=Aphanothece TaxID=1121 RepID=UPI00398F345B